MLPPDSLLAGWSEDERNRGREWVAAWKRAAPALAAVRRQELEALDSFTAIRLLCGEADYHVAPRTPRPSSGLVEQQRIFKRQRHL
jgi:hypothetical protein